MKIVKIQFAPTWLNETTYLNGLTGASAAEWLERAVAVREVPAVTETKTLRT